MGALMSRSEYDAHLDGLTAWFSLEWTDEHRAGVQRFTEAERRAAMCRRLEDARAAAEKARSARLVGEALDRRPEVFGVSQRVLWAGLELLTGGDTELATRMLVPEVHRATLKVLEQRRGSDEETSE